MNSLDAHLPQTHLLVIDYDDKTDVVTIEGVRYSGEFFRCFAEPNPQKLYRIERLGEIVTITESAWHMPEEHQ